MRVSVCSRKPREERDRLKINSKSNIVFTVKEILGKNLGGFEDGPGK